MAYSEITSTKTVNLTSASGTQTLTYYAGNKNKSTGSVVGNRDKKSITYHFDSTQSWITNVSITNKSDDTTNTAKNISITYNANTGSERSVNLKLKDQTSSYYLIIKQAGTSSSSTSVTKIVWNLTHICSSSSSKDIPSLQISYKLNIGGVNGILYPDEQPQLSWDRAFMGLGGLSQTYTSNITQSSPLLLTSHNLASQTLSGNGDEKTFNVTTNTTLSMTLSYSSMDYVLLRVEGTISLSGDTINATIATTGTCS